MRELLKSGHISKLDFTLLYYKRLWFNSIHCFLDTYLRWPSSRALDTKQSLQYMLPFIIMLFWVAAYKSSIFYSHTLVSRFYNLVVFFLNMLTSSSSVKMTIVGEITSGLWIYLSYKEICC